MSISAEAALTSLIALMRRSFVQFLEFAHPFTLRNHDEAYSVLLEIADDQSLIAQRATEMLHTMDRLPPSIAFPMEYTGSHDLSLDFLVERCITYQHELIDTLAALADSLPRHPSIRSLVDEAHGMSIAHLESLEECHRDG